MYCALQLILSGLSGGKGENTVFYVSPHLKRAYYVCSALILEIAAPISTFTSKRRSPPVFHLPSFSLTQGRAGACFLRCFRPRAVLYLYFSLSARKSRKRGQGSRRVVFNVPACLSSDGQAKDKCGGELEKGVIGIHGEGREQAESRAFSLPFR